jgi:hypothetical protein
VNLNVQAVHHDVPMSIPISISGSGGDFSSLVVSLQDADSVILHLKDKKVENFIPKKQDVYSRITVRLRTYSLDNKVTSTMFEKFIYVKTN